MNYFSKNKDLKKIMKKLNMAGYEDPLNFFQIFILIYFIKNPCKKCLVSACCSKTCDEKNNYLRYCDIHNDIIFNRLIVSSFWIAVIACIYVIIKTGIHSL